MKPGHERCEECGHCEAKSYDPRFGAAQLCWWCVMRLLDLDETEDKRWRWTGREWVRT